MPIFEVRCKEHGPQEVYLKPGSAPATQCPVCQEPADRIWSAPALVKFDFWAGWNAGAGRYFNTKREMHDWAAETGSIIDKDVNYSRGTKSPPKETQKRVKVG